MPSPLQTFFRRDVNDPIMVSRKRRGGVEWKARRVIDLGNENGVGVERRESLLRGQTVRVRAEERAAGVHVTVEGRPRDERSG